MKYNPALDGLRALAVLAVVAFHSRVPGLSGGFIGVDLFFVLSGYLITRVLAGNSDLRRFYWRRAKRLVPPLALMLAAYLAIFPSLVPGYPHWRDALLAFFYLSDYTHPLLRLPDYLAHTWSLAVEEHFYLLWPLVFLRWRPSTKALAVAYIALALWRFAWGDFWILAYSRFDTRAAGLILGCLLAGLPTQRLPAWPGLVALAAMAGLFQWDSGLDHSLGIVLVELAAAVAITGRHPAWLGSDLLAYVGKLSYGIYLWHYPIEQVMRLGLHLPWHQTFAVSLSLSTAAAAISFHTIEAWVRASGRSRPVNGIGEPSLPGHVA